MTQKVIFEGDAVILVDEVIQRRVSARDFLESIKEDNVIALPRLPHNIAFYYQKGNDVCCVIELPPGLYFLKTNRMRKGVMLSMPWQYFVLTYRKVREDSLGVTLWSPQNNSLLWSNHKITDFYDDRGVIPARLPNVYGSGNICFGDTAPESDMPLGERIDKLINEFFSPNSVFNSDLGWNVPSKYENEITPFRKWATESKQDPLCSLKWSMWDYTSQYRLLDYAGEPAGMIRGEVTTAEAGW